MSTGTQLSRSGGDFKKIVSYINDDKVKAQISRVLPRFITADEITRVCLSAVQKNPLLLQCTPESLCMELMRLGEMGLKPNGYEAHLVPFKEYEGRGPDKRLKRVNVVAIADWKGLVKLMYRSGQVVSVMAKAVRQKDKFSYRYGFGAFLEHEPYDADTMAGRGELKAAWAMAQLKDGGSPFVVLGRAEVLQRKKASRSSDSSYSPWSTHEDQMWAKSAVRELAKFVPLAPEIERALERDNDAEFGDEIIDVGAATAAALEHDDEDAGEGDEPPKQTKTQRLAAKAAESKKTTPPPTKKPAPEPEPEPEDEPTDEADDVIDEPVQEEAVDEPASDEQPAEDTRNRKQIMDDFQREIYADNVEPDDVDALLEHHIIFNQHKLTDADRRWAKNLADTRKRELEDAAERPAKKGGRK